MTGLLIGSPLVGSVSSDRALLLGLVTRTRSPNGTAGTFLPLHVWLAPAASCTLIGFLLNATSYDSICLVVQCIRPTHHYIGGHA
jgi:hypothetical protein